MNFISLGINQRNPVDKRKQKDQNYKKIADKDLERVFKISTNLSDISWDEQPDMRVYILRQIKSYHYLLEI